MNNSLLGDIKENLKKNTGNGNGNSVKALNFAITVTGYDNPYFLGVRTDTKEEVRVKLNAPPEVSNPKKRRKEIEDFEDPRSKMYATPGEAVIQFDKIYPVEGQENTFIANWANLVTSGKHYASGYCGYAMVQFVSPKNLIKVRMLKTEKAKVFNDVQSFEEFLINHCFTIRYPYHNPFGVLRILQFDDNKNLVDSVAIPISPKYIETKEENGQTGIQPASVEESLEKFKSRHCTGDGSLYNFMGKPNIYFELIPGATMRPGPDTTTKMLEWSSGVKQTFIDAYKFDKNEIDSSDNLGYVLTNVAIKKSETNDSFFLSFVKPNEMYSEPFKLEEIPTPNFSHLKNIEE